jgi:hypothetical protein
MKEYKVITESRRVRLLNIHKVKDDIFDLTYKTRRRIKPAEAVKSQEPAIGVSPLQIPPDSSITVSENGFIVYRNRANKEWVCPMSEQERTLIQAIATAKDACLDGNEAYKVLKLDTWRDTRKMKNIVGGINRKLMNGKVPVKISTTNWQYRFVEN